MSKILIVEDDKQLSQILNDKLIKEGFSVYVCGNGKEALDKVREEKYDLILLDLIMPIKSGLEFLEEYLVDTSINPLSIIVLTNLSDDFTKLKVYEKGVIQFLVKADSSLEVILSKIKEALKATPKYFHKGTF